MNFSLIIPLYNSNYIDIQIKSINSLYLKNIDLELIFIDDWSDLSFKKKYTKYLRKINNNINYKYIYIWEKKWQNRVCLARNLWVKNATSENLIFIDQDIILYKNYLIELKKNISENYIIIWPYFWYNNLVKSITNENIDFFIDNWFIKKENFDDFRLFFLKEKKDTKRLWEFFAASNLFIKKEIYLSIWWFDENIIKWWDEDVEFWYRLQKSWYEIIFNKNIGVLNLSEKLYNPPHNILEINKMDDLSNNWLYNFEKHISKDYLKYVLNRYNNLDDIMKERVSDRFKLFLKKINEI